MPSWFAEGTRFGRILKMAPKDDFCRASFARAWELVGRGSAHVVLELNESWHKHPVVCLLCRNAAWAFCIIACLV